MSDGTLWERVDEPVLRWVATLPPSLDMEGFRLELREPEPIDEFPGLTSQDLHESLLRLFSHGLIDGRESGAMRNSTWSMVRLTAAGLVVLGEWPDLDRVATAASLHRLLRALADDAPEAERNALRRAAGVAARTADEVVRGTVADIARSVGREVAGG